MSKYRELFFAVHGLGPYDCHFCKHEVGFSSVVIHHLDEDHANDAVENLVPAHRPCHKCHHGVPVSADGRARQAASMRGNTYAAGHNVSDEAKLLLRIAAIGNTRALGHRHTDESRRKIGAAQIGNTKCVGRIVSAETRARLSDAARRREARKRGE